MKNIIFITNMEFSSADLMAQILSERHKLNNFIKISPMLPFNLEGVLQENTIFVFETDKVIEQTVDFIKALKERFSNVPILMAFPATGISRHHYYGLRDTFISLGVTDTTDLDASAVKTVDKIAALAGIKPRIELVLGMNPSIIRTGNIEIPLHARRMFWVPNNYERKYTEGQFEKLGSRISLQTMWAGRPGAAQFFEQASFDMYKAIEYEGCEHQDLTEEETLIIQALGNTETYIAPSSLRQAVYALRTIPTNFIRLSAKIKAIRNKIETLANRHNSSLEPTFYLEGNLQTGWVIHEDPFENAVDPKNIPGDRNLE